MHLPTFKSLFILVLLIGVVILQPACKRQESNKPEGSQPPAQTEGRRDIPLYNENAYDEVLRELQAHPDNIQALYHLGDLYFRDGRYEKAVESFRKVLAADPTRGYVFFRMGTALNRLKRYEEALDAFRHALDNDLKNPTVAYNNMGITFGKLGRFQEEIGALKQAIALRPRYSAARYNLGVTLIKVGDIDGAREQYQALNEFDVTIAEALLKEINKAPGG